MVGRRYIGVGILAALVAMLLLLGWIVSASSQRAAGIPYVKGFESASGIDLLLAMGDGQSYAAIARDPTLSRPDAFPTIEEAAYRAQRPLSGYLAWLLALGRPEWVPGAMVAVTIASAGLAAGACAALLAHRSALTLIGLGVLVLPGGLAALAWLQPELLALGLAAAGLALWERRRRGLAAILLLTLAGLAREVLLLAPAMLALLAIRSRRWQDAARLTLPLLAWLLWGVVVRLRYGFWWFEWHAEANLEFPFVGMVHGISRWEDLGMNIAANAFVLGVLGLAVAGLLAIRGEDPLRLVALAYVIVPPFFWTEMWLRWQDFSRVLLPLTAFGGIALLGWARSRSAGPRSARDAAASPAPSPPTA